MRLLKPSLLLAGLVSSAMLSGCATFTSPARVHELEPNKPYFMDFDATRRGTVVVPGGQSVKMCSEPAPDVALNFAEKILVDVQAQNPSTNTNIDAKTQAELSAQAMELAGRTQLIVFLRESLFRLCEQSVNGNLSHDEVKQLYQLVIETSLKLAETDLAKNQKALAEALKDPNVRDIWNQIHNGSPPTVTTSPVMAPPKKH